MTAVSREIVERPRPKRRGLPFSGWHLFLAPVAILFLLPFVQMFMASVSPAAELVTFPPPFVPSRIEFGARRRSTANRPPGSSGCSPTPRSCAGSPTP